MTTKDLNNFAKTTDNLLGLGTVVNTKLIPNVYFEFELNNEKNAIEVERLWNKAFSKLNVIRNERTVTAG